MKHFVIREGLVWLALVGLTVFGFYNSGGGGQNVAYLVLGVGLAKFFLIFFDFMEMKHAHRVWTVTMTLFMLLMVGAISLGLVA